MINPQDVNLIIFDMDGTIVPSLPPVYEAIKRAFAKLDWPVNFRMEEIGRFFGVSTASTAGSLYEFITPPGSPFSIEEVREKVRAEYPAVFQEAKLFPGVKETLQALRRRGYKLAQYTNASTAYLNTCMDNLGLREYYDYIECIQDHTLDKVQLAKKIKEHFGGVMSAIVGDRKHDIEAAQATGSLSIGALYGYGGDEPKEADLAINSFDELLSIFDRRLPVFAKILGETKKKKSTERPFVVGINGIDCSGKTLFAAAFNHFLESKGFHTQLIGLDDFLNPEQIRYAGNPRDEHYYERVKKGFTFNHPWLVKTLLKPAREKGTYTTSLVSKTGIYDMVKEFIFQPETIVILEGVFLFIPELSPFIDYKIFLEIPFETCLVRAGARDTAETYNKYDKKYIPAQQKYLQEFPPSSTADMIIDNTDWENPVIK